MTYFDISDLTAQRDAELNTQPQEKLNAKLDPNMETGIQQVADLLTFLPEEQRIAAVKSFIGTMLTVGG